MNHIGAADTTVPRHLRCRGTVVKAWNASAANDLACLEAGGAHVELLTGTGSNLGPDSLNVRVPTTVGTPVRVRDRLTEAGPLGAYVADGSHSRELLELMYGYLLWCWPTNTGHRSDPCEATLQE